MKLLLKIIIQEVNKIVLKYQSDVEFFTRFKKNYFNCTPIEVIKTDINQNKIKVI